MTAWNSTKHADHQKAHADRKRAGLKAVTPAWHGLTASKVQEISRHAFRVVTWRYRAAQAADAQALRQETWNVRLRPSSIVLQAVTRLLPG